MPFQSPRKGGGGEKGLRQSGAYGWILHLIGSFNKQLQPCCRSPTHLPSPLQKEVITTRWANEDPNPTTIMAVKRSHMDLFEKVGHAPINRVHAEV